MPTIILNARIEDYKQAVRPEHITQAFGELAHNPEPESSHVILNFTYKRNMFERQSREYKQNQYLLATFVRDALEVVQVDGGVVPNYMGMDETLSYLDHFDIERIFDEDETKAVSHVNFSVKFEKRTWKTGPGKNVRIRTDYILTYGRSLSLGGKIGSVGRHHIITHLGSDYRDQYRRAPDVTVAMPYITHFLELLQDK